MRREKNFRVAKKCRLHNRRGSSVINRLGGQSLLKFSYVWTNCKLSFLIDHFDKVSPQVFYPYEEFSFVKNDLMSMGGPWVIMPTMGMATFKVSTCIWCCHVEKSNVATLILGIITHAHRKH